MSAYNLQFEFFFQSNVLLQTDATDITDDFLSYFKLCQELFICSDRFS